MQHHNAKQAGVAFHEFDAVTPEARADEARKKAVRAQRETVLEVARTLTNEQLYAAYEAETNPTLRAVLLDEYCARN